jgi:hypothetical protein
MKLYPVKVIKHQDDGPDTTEVIPFSNVGHAKHFRYEEMKRVDVIDIVILPTLQYEISKTGILEAFAKGQNLAAAE